VQSATADPGPPPVRRARLQLARRGPARHLGHRAFMVAVMRALRRAGWPLLHSSGFHPKPRLSFGPACQTGAASEAEWVDVRLLPGPPLATLAPRLAGTLDTGIALLDWRELEPGEPDLMAAASGVRYRIGLNGDLATEQIAGACRALLARPQWVVERQVKGRRKRVDLRPSLRRLEPVAGSRPPAVLLELELGPGACARPAEVARQAFGADCADITREALIWRTAEQKEACR
jgi:radical SAM-linked protein